MVRQAELEIVCCPISSSASFLVQLTSQHSPPSCPRSSAWRSQGRTGGPRRGVSGAAVVVQCDPTDDHEDADNVGGVQRVAKVQGANENQERTLQCVCHTLRYWGQEGHRVVRRHRLHVEEYCANECVHRHARVSRLCLHGYCRACRIPELPQQQWRLEERSHNGGEELQLHWSHKQFHHHLLGDHVLNAIQKIICERCEETNHVEAELVRGAQPKPNHHRKESQENGCGRPLAQNQPCKQHSRQRGRGFDRLREAHSYIGEADQPEHDRAAPESPENKHVLPKARLTHQLPYGVRLFVLRPVATLLVLFHSSGTLHLLRKQFGGLPLQPHSIQ
mmetsp:Transcript_10008/g.18890  ORF Transcript_10008/g.18890 Transcript_10008/m.18890 type:complete len:334 (+) Transcript_10008:727-1728(+)